MSWPVRTWRQAVGWSLLVVLALVALRASGPTATREAAAQDRDAKPTPIRPNPERRGVTPRLEKGDMLLYLFLQQFADFTGRRLVVDGRIPPEQSIRLERSPERLGPQDLEKILSSQGFTLGEVEYRGEKVLWVARRRESGKGKRGAIVRRGGQRTRADGAPATPRVHGTGNVELRLYQRLDGEKQRYLVVFESDSQAAAEEVYSIIEAARTRAAERDGE